MVCLDFLVPGMSPNIIVCSQSLFLKCLDLAKNPRTKVAAQLPSDRSSSKLHKAQANVFADPPVVKCQLYDLGSVWLCQNLFVTWWLSTGFNGQVLVWFTHAISSSLKCFEMVSLLVAISKSCGHIQKNQEGDPKQTNTKQPLGSPLQGFVWFS